MLIPILNDAKIILILDFKNSFEKYYPVFSERPVQNYTYHLRDISFLKLSKFLITYLSLISNYFH